MFLHSLKKSNAAHCMDFSISPDLHKTLRKIRSRDKKLLRKIEKPLILFQQNHRHPSLRTHKLSGNLENLWSISIDRHVRMLYVLEENEAYFFDIGTHEQVYKR